MAKYRVTFSLEGAWEEWLVESDSPDILNEPLSYLELVDSGNYSMQVVTWEKVED